MKFVHVNIVAEDWQKLAGFYIAVFGCETVPPERNFAGKWVEDLTGIGGAAIRGVHLSLPGYKENGPTLEIFQYNEDIAGLRLINRQGFAHIAFTVDDVEATLVKIIDAGGSAIGKTVTVPIEGSGTITVVYAADPEGNIIELQRWHREDV